MALKGQVYSNGFLKADALATGNGQYKEMPLTIASIRTGTVGEGDEAKQQRILKFNECDQELGLNVTNWETISEITGQEDDDNWIGHQIVLFVDPKVRFGNRTVPAIRVKAPVHARTPAPASRPTAPASRPAAGPPARPAAAAPTRAPAPQQPAKNKDWAWAELLKLNPKLTGDEFFAMIDAVVAEQAITEDAFGPDQWDAVVSKFIPI